MRVHGAPCVTAARVAPLCHTGATTPGWERTQASAAAARAVDLDSAPVLAATRMLARDRPWRSGLRPTLVASTTSARLPRAAHHLPRQGLSVRAGARRRNLSDVMWICRRGG